MVKSRRRVVLLGLVPLTFVGMRACSEESTTTYCDAMGWIGEGPDPHKHCTTVDGDGNVVPNPPDLDY